MRTTEGLPTEPRGGGTPPQGADVDALRARVAELEAELAAARREAGPRKAVEAALTRSEARGDAVLAALLDPTIVIDDRGTIQAASDSTLRVFGYAPRELAGKNVAVLMPEPHRSAHDGYLERYRSTGVTSILNRTREFVVVRKDGAQLDVELSVARAEMPDGRPLFVGSFRDVTERKRVESAVRESERRFHALFDEAFQFIGLLRPDGTLLEANRTATDAVELARDDAVGKLFWETRWWEHSKDAQAAVRDAVLRAATGELVRFEETQRGPGGSLMEVDVSIKPVRDETGAVVLLIAEGRDVTALKDAQRGETSMLRALAVVGEQAAVLAHEIKNPITAVNVALRAVAEQLGESDQAVIEDLVERMKRLERLMRATLSFARPIDIDRTTCDAKQLFARVESALRSQLEKASAVLATEVPAGGVRFSADAHWIEEVLTNLVTNALEAKSEGAHVVLSAAPAAGGGAVLAVEDDGPGVPHAEREAIFKPFVSTKASGTGLGLAICRKIVEEHGGEIRVETGRAGGARFVVQLGVEP